MASPTPVPRNRLTPADFVSELHFNPDDLVYFLINVGDGDSQFILLPRTDASGRCGLIVDIAPGPKLTRLVEELATIGVLDGPAPNSRRHVLPLVVATHPHHDHIGGMGPFLERFHEHIGEFWEPGYYHPAPGYIEMMRAL